jgi:archaeosortase C (PEF-CTERM variant)
MLDYRNLILFLIILALFLGATVEISEGYVIVGIMLIALIVVLLTRIKISVPVITTPSRFRMLLGISILLADIVYNLATNSELGTLDVMTLILGTSFLAQNAGREDMRKMGVFGAYMSAVFITLFLIFFGLFNKLGIGLVHVFDHYFVLLPTVFVIRNLGIPIEVVSTETVYISGIEEMTVIIGGPCSGLYSMFLLIATLTAYTHIEPVEKRLFLLLLVISIGIAYIANLTRVSVLYVVGYYFGTDTMLTVHVHLGWIIFVVVVLFLMFILDRVARNSEVKFSPNEECYEEKEKE